MKSLCILPPLVTTSLIAVMFGFAIAEQRYNESDQQSSSVSVAIADGCWVVVCACLCVVGLANSDV